MRLALRFLSTLLLVQCIATPSFAQKPRFKVLAFYSAKTEPDHVHFAEDAVKFFTDRSARENFTFEATSNWDDLNENRLKGYQVVVWLNDSPHAPTQRSAFEHFMQRGGAWLGFHAAGYNDEDTHWPWFVDLLGGAVFDINSWPPLPAHIVIGDPTHPVMSGLPSYFESPANEWYVWKPSPRLNKDVRVLATLNTASYPLGFKDVLLSGDLPVVWTNTKYKMLYMNMGHGDKIFESPIQNQLIDNALNWLGTGAPQALPPEAHGIRVSPNGVVLNSHTDKFYAVNTNQGTVTVLDADGQLAKRISTGQEPAAIAVNAVTNRIFVANQGSSTVSVIDGTTDAVLANVDVGPLPYAIAVNSAANKIYISKTFSNVMTVIDGRNNTASTLKPDMQADAMAVDNVDNKVYLTSYQNPEMSILDGTTDRVSNVNAQNHLWAIATNPAAHKAYAISVGNSNVTIVDEKSGATHLVGTGRFPCAVAVDSASGRVFIANYVSDSVTVLDGRTDSIIGTINAGSNPQAIAVDSGNHKVYVANTRARTVTVLDGISDSVITTLKTDGAPFAIAADAKTHMVAVLSLDGGLTVINGANMTPSSVTEPKATQ